MERPLGVKALRFLEAVRAVCREHQVILAVAGTDQLQVWDARPGEAPLECYGIEDCTGIRLASSELGEEAP